MSKKKPYSSNKPLNARQKQFCIKYASGMTASNAYKEVYNSTILTAERESSRLMTRNPLIKPYIDGLIKRKEDLSLVKLVEDIMSPKERQVRLTELARARLTDFLDEKGEPRLDKDTPHNAAAKEFMHKIRVDRFGNPIISKNIKLVDAIEAIRELNRMDGSYAPSKHLVGHRVQFDIELIDGTKRLTDATE